MGPTLERTLRHQLCHTSFGIVVREVAHNNARTRVTRLSLPNPRKHLTTTILSHKFWHCCARLRAQQCQKLCDTIVVAKCVRELGPMFLLYLLSSLFPLMSSLYCLPSYVFSLLSSLLPSLISSPLSYLLSLLSSLLSLISSFFYLLSYLVSSILCLGL